VLGVFQSPTTGLLLSRKKNLRPTSRCPNERPGGTFARTVILECASYRHPLGPRGYRRSRYRADRRGPRAPQASPASGGGDFIFPGTMRIRAVAPLCEDLERLAWSRRWPVCVDHEGGRVQRFREGFTRFRRCESSASSGTDREAAREAARRRRLRHRRGAGRARRGNFSFAPVLDSTTGPARPSRTVRCTSIPTRWRRSAPASCRDSRAAGMAAVGKHFPGHGFAPLVPCGGAPRDDRPVKDIFSKDVVPYRKAIEAGLAAVMPAHVIYTQSRSEPAGYSRYWLQEVLRGSLGFEGLVFKRTTCRWSARALRRDRGASAWPRSPQAADHGAVMQ